MMSQNDALSCFTLILESRTLEDYLFQSLISSSCQVNCRDYMFFELKRSSGLILGFDNVAAPLSND